MERIPALKMDMGMCSSPGRLFFVGHGSSRSASRKHSFSVVASKPSEGFSTRSSKLVNFWDRVARGGLADTAILFHSAYSFSQTLSIEGNRRAKSSNAFPLGSGKYTVDEIIRQQIIGYLETDWNIDTRKLDGVELPGSKQLMRELLMFLWCLGVEVKEVVDCCPQLLGCSVSRNFKPVLEYLRSLGIEGRGGLINLIETYPEVLQSNVVVDLQPHVEYLQGLGVEPDMIGRILVRYPEFLSLQLEGTPTTSIAYLISIGVNKSEVGRMVSNCPEILGMEVASNMKPKVEFLESLGFSEARIASLLEKWPRLLRYSLESQIESGVTALRHYFPYTMLPDIIERFPSLLGRSPLQGFLDNKAAWLQDNLEITYWDIDWIFSQSPEVVLMPKSEIEERLRFLREAGLSKADVGSVIRQSPKILEMSVANDLKPHVEYLVNKLGRPVSELVTYPFFFEHDIAEHIERRVKGFAWVASELDLSTMLQGDEELFRIRTELYLYDDD